MRAQRFVFGLDGSVSERRRKFRTSGHGGSSAPEFGAGARSGAPTSPTIAAARGGAEHRARPRRDDGLDADPEDLLLGSGSERRSAPPRPSRTREPLSAPPRASARNAGDTMHGCPVLAIARSRDVVPT